ncbi:MAG TPA: SPFH/Band 7/PHB domain protein, partial [Methanocorpusculum sp.]|nr:SPFH/Band 7/PHB domain protein [Methanocorpusculum sp.]
KILQAQGEAQGLRIVALGSRPLDKRAITVLSLNTMQKMADGQATKIIFPFEVSNLIKQGAKFLGAEDPVETDDTPQIELNESILGDLPDPAEIAKAVKSAKPQETPNVNPAGVDDVPLGGSN